MSYRATTSCRLHHSPAESPMASRARQAYSLAVVMCMRRMLCLLIVFVNNGAARPGQIADSR